MLNDLGTVAQKQLAAVTKRDRCSPPRGSAAVVANHRGLILTLGDLSVYGALFLSALLAATILPMSSEAVLAGLLASRPGETPLLLGVATIGNTLGSVINWLIGRAVERLRDRPWFPVSPERYAAAEVRFRRYGWGSLLFAWVPIVGDPLTVIAGVLRVPLVPFVILVGIGKAARYATVAAGVSLWVA